MMHALECRLRRIGDQAKRTEQELVEMKELEAQMAAANQPL